MSIWRLTVRGGAEAVTLALGAAVDTGEASLTGPPLTACRAARFLTGRGPVPVHGRGLGTPDLWGEVLAIPICDRHFPQMLRATSCSA